MPRANPTRWTVATLATLLLLTGAAGQPSGGVGWKQFGGGPDRAGVHDVGAQPLDLLAHGPILPEGSFLDFFDVGLAATPHGLVGLSVPILGGNDRATPTALCQLHVVDPMIPAARPLGEPISCPAGAHFGGYVAGLDVLLVSVDGLPTPPGLPSNANTGLLRAYDASDGTERWRISPEVVGAPGADNTNDWFAAPLIDEAADRLYVAFNNDVGNGRIDGYRLSTQELLWTYTETPTQQPVQLPDLDLPSVQPPEAATSTIYNFLTRSQTGLVATTLQSAGAGNTQAGAGATLTVGSTWLDFDGNLIGRISTPPEEATPATTLVPATTNTLSTSAAANGANAAAFVGRTLYVIDATRPTPIPIQDASLTANVGFVGSPAWSSRYLVAPAGPLAYVVDAGGSGRVTTWNGHQVGTITQVLLNGDRDLYGLVINRGTNGDVVYDLLRVALPDGLNLQRWSVPIERATGGLGYPGMSVDGDGRVVVFDSHGNVATFGARPASQQPTLRLESLYPATDEPVRIDWQAPAGSPPVRLVRVGWGDGLLREHNATDVIERTYFGEARDAIVHVSLVYADNSTATAELLLHLGQDPPEEKGLVATLFSPENQNYTFFAIGLIVTLVGSLYTAMGVARGRRRIAAHLQALDAIQEEARTQPFDAVRDLHSYREARRIDLAKGHLSDGQFAVIEAQALELLTLLRQRILGGFVGRVSDPFSHALDTAIADGAVDDREAGELEAMAAREKALSPQEKERLRNLVKTWNRAL